MLLAYRRTYAPPAVDLTCRAGRRPHSARAHPGVWDRNTSFDNVMAA